MINIEEKLSKKAVGKTSLFVTFQFNMQIVEALKSIGNYQYNKDTHEWEFPISKLSSLIDTLTYLDDIQINLLEEDSSNSIHQVVQHELSPFGYQSEGIDWLINRQSGLLLDEMGLGKSAQIIYTAEELKAQKGIEHCLIICCVNTLKQNWKKEIQKFSKESVRVIGEKVNKKGNITYASVSERAEELYEPIDDFFIIMNIECLRDSTAVAAIQNSKNKFDMIAVDEVHRCLAYDSIIYTDKGKLQIGDIVENSINCNVISYNEVCKSIEYKPIESFFKINNDDKLIELDIQSDDGEIHTIKCTPNHKIYTTNRGWVEASNLNISDDIKIENI